MVMVLFVAHNYSLFLTDMIVNAVFLFPVEFACCSRSFVYLNRSTGC